MARLFLLNFDAEYEMALGSTYRANAAMAQRLSALAETFSQKIAKDDRTWLFAHDPKPTDAHNVAHSTRLWCATEQAQNAAKALGASEPWPTPAAVRAVNHRLFAHQLAQTLMPDDLPSARFFSQTSDLSEFEQYLGSAKAERWLAKRAFGVAGREQRVLEKTLSDADRKWLLASATDGFALEPWVAVDREFSTHAWIADDGRIMLGKMSVCVHTDGSWTESRLAGTDDLSFFQRQKLGEVAHQTGSALFAAGYFGPYGVDAYIFKDARGRERLRTLSEINARFCMNWDPELDGWDPP